MLPFWFGTIVGLAPWVSIVYNVAAADTVPGFVYGIVLTQALLFFSFGLNQWLQYRRIGRWSDYVYGAVSYTHLDVYKRQPLLSAMERKHS